jgi:acyl carrier protein
VNQAVFERVQRVATDIFNVPAAQIVPAATPEMIEGWDSLQHLNLVVALEQEFGLQFTAEDVEQLQTPEENEEMITIGLLVKVLESKVTRMASAAMV